MCFLCTCHTTKHRAKKTKTSVALCMKTVRQVMITFRGKFVDKAVIHPKHGFQLNNFIQGQIQGEGGGGY